VLFAALRRPHPITAAVLGNLDMGQVWGRLTSGPLLLAARSSPRGLWLSSQTRNRSSRSLLGLVSRLPRLRGPAYRARGLPRPLSAVFEQVAVTTHFRAMGHGGGAVDLRDVAYFVSLIGFFLYRNVGRSRTGGHR